MGATLHDFGQGKRLLTRFALYLLRPGVIFFQLFKLLRVALQYRDHRLKFRQLVTVLLNKARRFLRFIQTLLNFIHAIGQRFIGQQVQTRQETVEQRNALFRLFVLRLLLLVITFVAAQRAFQLVATGIQLANFRFRIVVKRHRQVTADKAAERLMQTLGFLDVERQGRKTFRQHFTLGVQALNAAFARGAAKQRHRREARITPLAVGGLHHYRFFQLVDVEHAVIEGLRIPFNEVEIFRAIFQPFQILGDLRQIRHHDRMARRTIQRGEVRRVVQADVIINFRQQYAAKTFSQRVKARVFGTARLA